VLSISFEVDVPTGKVGGSLLFERQRHKPPRGLGTCPPPQKILKFRCLEMLFSMLSRQYLGLKKNQNENYINHILCLLQPLFISKFLARMPFWHLWKTGIYSCENVPGVPRPSASTFYTSTERLTHLKVLKCTFISTQTFEADLSQLFFVGSFPYFKFLSTKINSEVRRK